MVGGGGCGAGEVGGVLSRVRCGCVGDANGVGAKELSVDDEDDGGSDNAERARNCPRLFLGVEATVRSQSKKFLKTRCAVRLCD